MRRLKTTDKKHSMKHKDVVSIASPAVRKDFWELVISRHPIEEDYAPSTKNAYRWRSLPKLRLVIVQFVSEYGVGVFVRGEKGSNPEDVENRLRPHKAKLMTSLQPYKFVISRRGAPPAKFFFQKFREFDTSQSSKWPKMADWLHQKANTYERALREVFAAQISATVL